MLIAVFILKSYFYDFIYYWQYQWLSLCPFRPDLIDFENLKRSNAHYNLQNAFNVAEKELGLTKLLDPEGEWLQSPQKHLTSSRSHWQAGVAE